MQVISFLNKALSLNLNTGVLLETLEHKCVSIQIKAEEASQTFFVIFSDNGIQTITQQEREADVHIGGSIRSFYHLLISKNMHYATKLGLSFSGDPTTLETLQRLFWTLEIDWEELLSYYTNDIFAYQLFSLLKTAHRQKTSIINTFAQNFSEYLKEESTLFSPKPKTDRFIQEVDDLRSNLDRLEIRMHHLLAKETVT